MNKEVVPVIVHSNNKEKQVGTDYDGLVSFINSIS